MTRPRTHARVPAVSARLRPPPCTLPAGLPPPRPCPPIVSAVPIALSVLGGLWACDVSRPTRVDDTPTCPTWPTALTVATDCELGPTSVTVQQRGCALTLEFVGTDRVRFEGTLDADGALTLAEVEGRPPCREASPRRGALRRIECARTADPCGYDLHRPAPPREVPVARAAVIAAPFVAPPRVAQGRSRPLDQHHPLEGYLTAMVVRGRGAWVATASGAYATADCLTATESTLVRVDDEGPGLGLSRPVPAPSCLRALAPDPADPRRFFGVSGGRPPRLHAFDERGEVLRTVDVPAPTSRDPALPVVVIALEVPAPPEEAPLLYLVLSTMEKRHEAWLLVFDRATLALLRTSEPSVTSVRAASPALRDLVFGADHDSGELVPFHTRDQGLDIGYAVDLVGGPSDDVGFISYHAPTDQLVVSTTGEASVLWLVHRVADLRKRQFVRTYEGPGLPWASTPWPAEPAEQLVGLTGLGPTFEAGLAWLDVAERHVIPGVLPIGRGVVRALASDEAGRVWALLPWSGEIVRVGP